MKQKNLFKLALIGSTIGIVLLFFISNEIKVDQINIGKINKVHDSGKIVFLEVAQEKIEEVSVILFKDRPIDLKKGDYVELLGEVEEYKGEHNIIANAIKVR